MIAPDEYISARDTVLSSSDKTVSATFHLKCNYPKQSTCFGVFAHAKFGLTGITDEKDSVIRDDVFWLFHTGACRF